MPHGNFTPPHNPFAIEVPRPPHFRTTFELLEKLEEAWMRFKYFSLDPVFSGRCYDPVLGENFKNAVFQQKGSKAFDSICKRWATHEDLTFDIPQFFFEKLKAYVRMQCRALYSALQRESDTVVLDMACDKAGIYWSLIQYVENYFVYFKTVQTELVYDTEHEIEMSKIRLMMALTFKDEVFSPLGVRLRRIALQNLERKRYGDEEAAMTVKAFEGLIDIISISKEFTEAEWDFALKESCLEDLIRKEQLFKENCPCFFIKEAYSRVHEVASYGVGSTTLFTFRNMIFPMVQRSLFADDGRTIIHLINAEAKIALKRLCQTFGYEQELMKKIANIIEKFMREKFIGHIIRSFGTNPTPMLIFTNFFSAWVKISVLCAHIDQKGYNKYIIDALADPFDPIITKYELSIRETLLDYFCSKLSKKPEEERLFGKSTAEELEAAVVLLSNLPDKVEFLGKLMSKLMKNLPCQEFSSQNVEYFLQSLKDHFPHMAKVFELKGLLKIVINQEKNLAEYSPNTSPWKQIPDPNSIPISDVKALQRADWPQQWSAKIKLPGAMEQAMLSYSCFFHFKHGDKDFEFNFSYDRVIVTTSLFSQDRGEIDIHMTTDQMSVLDLFQEHNSLSVFQIMEMIQLRNDNGELPQDPVTIRELVLRVLLSMMGGQYPLFKKTPEWAGIDMEDVLFLNMQFISPGVEIMLPVP